VTGICEGRVVIVTGGGRGLGRAHAMALAAEGASVVVNDLGVGLDGGSSTESPAALVVNEIRRAGGRAVANSDDVTSWIGAERLIDTAVAEFGRIDALVCNAGNLLDRHLADMSEKDWGAVVSTHLTGHAAPLRHAAAYWRESGGPNTGRVVLTTSTAGIWPAAGRANYNSAKAGIVALGQTAALELARYGVCVNTIAPYARTRMTISLDADLANEQVDGFDTAAPANISPLVVWLCSVAAEGVTGQVFEIHAGRVGIIEPPRRGRFLDIGHRWEPAAIGLATRALMTDE
jgi:NAD(P)-dependent dehydrogenase (short-subunit alcohol dehydrogenase family)